MPEIAPPNRAPEKPEDIVAESDRLRRLYDTILSNTPDLVYVFDLNHRFSYANASLLRMWGKEWNQAIGKNCLELGYEPWHAAMHDREIEQVIATKRPIRGEVPFNGTNGWRFYDYIFVPVLGPDGAVEAIAGTTRDITDRRDSEDALRNSEERLRAFVSATADVIYSMSPDWTEMRFLQGKEFVPDTTDTSRTWLQKYIHPDDHAFVTAKISEAIRTKSMFELEHRIIRADGRLGWTYSRAVPMLDENGEIVEWFGAAADVTRRKVAEDAVVKSEKLVAMGRLAGTIAHEINNPLEAATNIAYLLRNNHAVDEKTRYLVQTLQEELSRVAHITRQSLGFYRESSKLVEISLASIIDEVVELLQRKAQKNGVSADRKYYTKGGLLSFPGEMRQVFLNLIGNSIEAMPQGGRLRVHLFSSRDWSGGGTRLGFRINVCDTGSGISPESAKKIFEPFFTTKDDKGTGLGLWVTRGIIHKHEGSIRFRSSRFAASSVTCFSVFLPYPKTRVSNPQLDSARLRVVEHEIASQ